MSAAWWLSGALVLGFLAGCIASPRAALEDDPLLDVALPTLAIAGGPAEAGQAVGSEALVWNGSALDVAGTKTERTKVNVALPDGFWDANDGFVEFALRWELFTPLQLDMVVYDPQGNVVGRGTSPHAFIGAQGTGVPVLGSASVLLVPGAKPGAYEIEAVAKEGSGAYVGIVQVESAVKAPDAEPRDLLPNIVTLPPRDLGIRAPEADPPAGTKGCRADEVVFGVTTRCLRFSNGIGNTGEGPLELFLPVAEGAKGLGAMGTFTQRIHRTDGTHEDRAIGTAAFHGPHAHFHYQDSAVFELYEYDVPSHTRGALVVEGRKTGFCFADLDLVENGLLHSRLPRFDGTACWDPTIAGGQWSTGLNPTWYDRYHWSWFEQFVDVTNVPDGTYELVSTANRGGTLVETTTEDNANSAVFALSGDDVTELFVPEKEEG